MSYIVKNTSNIDLSAFVYSKDHNPGKAEVTSIIVKVIYLWHKLASACYY